MQAIPPLVKMADFYGYIIAFVIWLVSFILVRAIFSKTRTTSRLPPSPMALPIIGHFHHLLRGGARPHQALGKLSTKYGPLMYIRLGSIPCLVASSPETAKLVFQTHESSFLNRPLTAATYHLSYGLSDFSFAPYGPFWKFMKKICMSKMLNGPTLDRFLPVRRQELSRFLQLLVKKGKTNEKVNFGLELSRLMNNNITRMMMNRRCSDSENEAEEVRELLEDVAELLEQFNASDFFWFCKNLDLQGMNKKLRRVRGKFDAMMDRIIMEHEEERTKRKVDDAEKDLLDILLDISEDETSEKRLNRENIKAFILDIFAGGTHSSAVTMEWGLSELINHPNIMKKARQEIEAVVGKNRIVQESDIHNLPYLQAIAKETLRLHPAAPINPRECSEDCSIQGYEIPAKTRLFVNLWAIGRDPNFWEKPLEFRPERFLEGDPMDVRGQHFHLLPFGSGRRTCPGTTMALHVVQTTLAALIQCFDYEVDGVINGVVDMEEGHGVTVQKANPLICVPILRLNPFPL